MNKRQKGFTLIELLVVIAIIGILSSVVLASLNTARGKGSDAAAESGLSSLQSQAALYYSSNSTYNSTVGITAGCAASNSFYNLDSQSKSIIANITSNAGSITCSSASSTYAVSVSLKSGAGNWCVDSSGNATSTAVNTSDGLCI